jgi:predicted dehydrogenase
MAGQLAERFRIPGVFTDVPSLLESSRPDVVHITTPPQSHFDVARTCLQFGAHTFVEKPFTVNATEAQELVQLARQQSRKITVHHEQQFTDPARRARQMIVDGFLGGPPILVESYYGYELGSDSYARALLGDKTHWVRRLPGQLLHNVISHGISKIAEFIPNDSPTVIAHGFASQFLRRIGEDDIVDELRVIVSDRQQFTAYFTFSSQMRPNLHLLRVYGTKNGLEVDHDRRTLTTLEGARGKSILEKLVSPLKYAWKDARNSGGNVRRFLRRELHPRDGSLHLLEKFYEAIRYDTDEPVSHRELVLTVQVMDEIFSQVYGLRSPVLKAVSASRG